jgi:hypothetical protein
VHATAAVFHDGLRTSLPELWKGGRDRRALAAYSYSLSIGFILAYALPYSLATGIIVIHLILLTADMVGLRIASRWLAVAVGLVYGVGLSVGVDVFVSLARVTADYGPSLQTLFTPLAYTFPLMAAVAAATFRGIRWGIAAAAFTVVVWRVADIALHGGGVFGELTPTGGAIALVATAIVVVLVAGREVSAGGVDLSALYEPNLARIKKLWPYLIAPPALIGLAGAFGWLAGEPAQLVMLAVGSPEAAAAIAFFSALGFMPMIAMSGLLSGVWNEDGYCDWYLGASYLARPVPILGALAGVVLVTVEILSLRRLGRLLTTRPGINAAGSAMRDALDSVPTLSILAGGVWSTIQMAGPIGALTVLGAWTFNEAKGRPIMPLAVPVFAFLAVAIVVDVAHRVVPA